MNGFSMFAMLAGIGTVASFISGIRSMIYHGTGTSTAWMFRRVAFQGAAFVTVFAALLSKM